MAGVRGDAARCHARGCGAWVSGGASWVERVLGDGLSLLRRLLDTNKLTGTIPTALGNLSSLQTL